MKLKAAEAAFLVTKDTWYGGLESFVEQHRQPGGRLDLEPVHDHFNQENDPILVDRDQIRHAFIANLMPDVEPTTDTGPLVKAVARMIAWLAGSLVLHIRFTVDTDRTTVEGVADSEEVISSLLDKYVRSLEEAARPSPVFLCWWLFFADEFLDSVNSQDESTSWIKAHFSRTSGDLFASFGAETTILHIEETSTSVTFHWYMPQTDSELHPYMHNEIRAVDIHLATRALFGKMKTDVEATIIKARETVERENPNPAAPSLLGLIASLNPRHDDDLQTISGRISELNHGVLSIQNSIARLESLYSIFHEGWPWQYDSLKLARVGYARGRLTTIEQDEVGQVTLAQYYRRSDLKIEEFYRHRFDQALQGLLGQLEYLRTVAALRAEQRATVLNRLVLLLTFATIILAILQIFSALPHFQNNKLLLIFGALVVVAIVGVILAGKRSNHHRRQT